MASLAASVVPLLLALTWATDFGWSAARVQTLLGVSALMAVVFVYVELQAAEPLIPLSLFRMSIITLCSVCSFVVGMGMFGVIVYVPLFMQGVIGVSATQSGNLMMPMMMGTVIGTALSGALMSRMGAYKPIAIAGIVLTSLGMGMFARMTASTGHLEVVIAMMVAGFGLGLVMPTYTVAVQNVAPRAQLGAATASTIFFRSVGSTVGVAIFGSVMLMNYHRDFARAIPPGAPANTMALFSNPLMLTQLRPQLEVAFAGHGGAVLMQALLAQVGVALERGLHLVFVASAILMTASILLHLGIRNVRLRSHSIPEPEMIAH